MLGMALDNDQVKSLNANRIDSDIHVDGLLNEEVWETANAASGFTEFEPQPNTASSQQTVVKVLYDDEAIYVGAIMHDSSPDSILNQFTERDEYGNSDYFGFWLSCFNDGINAFEFFVSPAGIQLDAQVTVFKEDYNWNAVWQCNTRITEEGWTAEFKIPYSALRFPDGEEQQWDVNFIRSIRRVREKSYWQPIQPTVDGQINQSGKLFGIQNVVAPVRLFFTPYASSYLEIQSTPDGIKHGTSFNGGMDVKYGINDAFTLDMTLIPDFGQVVADNKVFNLSPFEIEFGENRSFFTEGTELFTKGGLFYSRRVAGLPIGYNQVNAQLQEDEQVIDNPLNSQLYNATKLSGRNSKGLGIGFFNAISQASYATLEDLDGNQRQIQTAPMSNYNIFVLDQNLKNNSYFTLINSNVIRNGESYDANVLGTDFRIRNKLNKIELKGSGAWNKKLNFDQEDDQGFTSTLGVSKIGGNWTYGTTSLIIDNTYDPNDLGFLTRNNRVAQNNFIRYTRYEPKGKFNKIWSTLNINYNRLYKPSVYTSTAVSWELNAFTRKFNAGGIGLSAEPSGVQDYFEPRRPGERFYAIPESYGFNAWYSTDYRKQFAYDISVNTGKINESGRYQYSITLEPRFRVNDKLMLIYAYTFENLFNDVGWVADDENDDIILGRRHRNTQSQLLTANYIFTNRISLSFRLRHYWSSALYNQFFKLENDGSLSVSESYGFDENRNSPFDRSYNAFNIDMVFRWVFAPGSEINIVWKNSIEELSDQIPVDYYENFNRAIGLPQTNSFSIRLLYFIDYHDLRSGGKFIQN